MPAPILDPREENPYPYALNCREALERALEFIPASEYKVRCSLRAMLMQCAAESADSETLGFDDMLSQCDVWMFG